MGTIKLWLPKPRIDAIMHAAQPQARAFPRSSLWRKLFEQLLEVVRAVATGVEEAEEVDELFECLSLGICWLFWVSQGHRVQESPSCPAEFGSG